MKIVQVYEVFLYENRFIRSSYYKSIIKALILQSWLTIYCVWTNILSYPAPVQYTPFPKVYKSPWTKIS